MPETAAVENPTPAPSPAVDVAVEVGELTRMLRAVRPATGRAAPTDHVMLRVETDRLSVCAGNYDLLLRLTKPLPGIRRTAEAAVPIVELTKVLATIPGGSVDVSFPAEAAQGLRLVAGEIDVVVTVASVDSSAFAVPEPRVGSRPVARGDYEFVDAIRSPAFAASNDSMRPVLTAIYVNEEYAVATDSYRLAVAAHKGTINAPFMLPASVVPLLPSEGDIELRGFFRTNEPKPYSLTWSVGPLDVEARCIDGDFPNWTSLIPGECPIGITVDRDELLAAARAVKGWASSSTSAKDAHTVKIVNKQTHLQVRHERRPTGVVRVPAEIEGDWTHLAFNPGFLVEMLEAFSAEEVVIEGTDPLKPVIIEDDDDSLTVLLMPVRVT